MGFIADLENRLNELKESTPLKQVLYDRIDGINADSKNNYPLCLFRVTDSGTESLRKPNRYENIEVEFFFCDLHYSGDVMKLTEKKDYLNSLSTKVLKSVPTAANDFELLNNSRVEFAWEQHNDNLVIAKRTASYRVFVCDSEPLPLIGTFDETFDETFL
jgi:hypothetical protein